MGKFKPGEEVTYGPGGTSGRVVQVEGGADGDLTEVFWPAHDQAIWVRTKQLVAAKGPA